jgi:hypothetical protein
LVPAVKGLEEEEENDKTEEGSREKKRVSSD